MINLRRLLALAAFALPLSQLGHVVAYGLRYGEAGFLIEASGAHSYFPLAAGFAGASLGGSLLLILLLVGATRLVIGRRRGRVPVGGWSMVSIVAILAAVQLGVFSVQEIAESLAGGQPPDFAAIAVFGLLGQLPIACIASLLVNLASTSFEELLRVARQVSRFARWHPWSPRSYAPAIAPANLLEKIAPSVFVKRGPPVTS